VKFFHGGRGYGFIEDGTGVDVFVHHSNVPDSRRLATGTAVEFSLGAGKKGPEATAVAVL